MKPGADFTRATVLPQEVARSATASATAGSVCSPVTTSTSLMRGTGLKKCIPTTRDGIVLAAAISVTDKEDVLVARMHAAPKCASASASTLLLTARSSRTASTTTVPGSAGAFAIELDRQEAVVEVRSDVRAAVARGAARSRHGRRRAV